MSGSCRPARWPNDFRSVEESSRSERDALEALVSAEAEAAREVGGNVAEGLSDLNPETRERMAALAAENEKLRRAVDAQAAERVRRLEDELEDASAGKKTFEEVRVWVNGRAMYVGWRGVCMPPSTT